MKFDKRLTIALAAAATAAAGLGVFAMTRADALPVSGSPTAVATLGDVEQYVLATGSLEPSTVVEVGSEVSGRVAQLKVALGDHVHQGDLIAVVEADRQAAQVRQAQSAVTQAETTLRDRTSQVGLAQGEVDRQKILLE
ncbi:MAG: biotin/lipoyl-binding protein, partial [Alphaproteobacteria bacterium]